MKRIFVVVAAVFLVVLTVMPDKVYADDIGSEFEEIFSENGIDITPGEVQSLEAGDIVEKIKTSLGERISAPLKTLGIILTLVLVMSFLKITGENGSYGRNSDIFSLVCVLSSMIAIMPGIFDVFERTYRTILNTGGFVSVFVPAFAGVTAAMGGLGSAGVYNMMILGASELFIQFTNNLFMPIVSTVSAVSAAGAVFSDCSLEKLAALVKKVLVWAMTAVMTLFSGFVTLKCTLAGKADGVATKTVKLAVSGLIPVAGGAVTDAYSTVRSSFDVIRCTAGAAGTIGIMLIMLPPVLEIAVYRLVMWIGSAAGEMFSAEPITKLLSALDCGLAIAQTVLISYSLIFVLCTGILMNCVS